MRRSVGLNSRRKDVVLQRDCRSLRSVRAADCRARLPACKAGGVRGGCDVRCVFQLWQIGYTATIMSTFGQSRPDESYKKEQWFRRLERARISWGDAMRGRGPGEGPNSSRSGRPNLDAPYLPKFKNSVRERQRVRIPVSMNSLAEGEPFFRFRATSSTVVCIDGVRPKIRFALDSPLEGKGFEPSVPLGPD